MTTKHTPGNWTLGKTGGTVVSDQPLPNYTARGGHDETRYYGGYLIAESIWREEDARLIAAAPEHHAVALELDKLMLVIESAVRRAEPRHHAAVLSLIHANTAALAKARGAQ